MATADQIKALIRSYYKNNPDQFLTTALQIAAHEARQGHGELADDIRKMIDQAQKDSSQKKVLTFAQDLNGLIFSEEPKIPFSSLVVNPDLKHRIERITLEFRQQSKLKSHGLNHRRKILLSGAPGTGKTMTARILASELRQLLHVIQMDRLVTKFMGETSAKLRQIFEKIQEMRGVYLFDEFDAIGGERALSNDVGEMRRVLNAFLQFIESDPSPNLILAATNNPRLLDRALFRRFDDVLFYELPEKAARKQLMANVLGTFADRNFPYDAMAELAEGLSQAEIDSVCRDTIKSAVLTSETYVAVDLFQQALKERLSTHQSRSQ